LAEATGPSEFVYANEAWTPLAISKVQGDGDAEAYPSKRVLWRWGNDGRFHGPEKLWGFEPKGTDGRYVYLERQVEPQADAAPDNRNVPKIPPATVSRIFSLDNGGPAEDILAPTGSDAILRFTIAEARNGFGPILLTERADPELPERPLQERWSARGTKLSQVEGYKNLRYAFPRAGLKIDADEHALDVTDVITNTRLTVGVPTRDDVNGIESLMLDRFGWLFVENGGSDYAVKLARNRHGLRTDRVVEFTGRGWLSRIVSFLFGADKGVRIDRRQWSSQCANQSAVLGMALFCKPFRALRSGRLEKVDKLPSSADRWIGDATGKGVALLRTQPGGLYATDGYGAQRISNLNLRLPFVQDVPEAGRTFVTAGGHAWEVVGGYPNLRLRQLIFSAQKGEGARFNCCLSEFGSSNVRFIAVPGTSKVLAVHSTLGIWLLGADHAKMVWKTDQFAINLNSVARADVWSGLVFLTENHTPYLLKRC
jgi:hypothetical protein